MVVSPLFQNAVLLHKSGKFDEAEAAYRGLLRHDPTHADALSLLAVVVAVRGALDEAMGYVDQAIRLAPHAAYPFFHRGNILMGCGRLEEAMCDFRRVLEINPHLAEAHYNLGNALRAAQQWPAAQEAYATAIACNPDFAQAYNNLALCHIHNDAFDAALELSQKMVERFPDYGDGWITLSNVAEKQKNYDRALSAAERAVHLCPDSIYAWFGYGVALSRFDRYEEAVQANVRGLQIKPDYADLWDNLGQVLQSMGNLGEAEKAFRTCIDVSGQTMSDEQVMSVHADAFGNRHWHLALLELLQGKYRIGFARYRSRFMEMGDLRKPNYRAPVWQGECLSGKTILVTDEQGFGDTLMLARFLPSLKHSGATVVFSVHPALRTFFLGWSAGLDRLVVHGDVVTGHDYTVSIFDVPHWLGVDLDNLPRQPYLPVPDYPDTLPDCRGLRVGLVWGGNPIHVNDRRRSVPLQQLVPLLQLKDIEFYSFNRDMRDGDAALLQKYGVRDLVPLIQDFAQSASYLRQMDLVVSCDTSTVHLAGGMGVPVWVMLPFMPDWRWLMGRNDSPWYPSARLFRQKKSGDWGGVVAAICDQVQNQ